jgi:hypothetical protein
MEKDHCGTKNIKPQVQKKEVEEGRTPNAEVRSVEVSDVNCKRRRSDGVGK